MTRGNLSSRLLAGALLLTLTACGHSGPAATGNAAGQASPPAATSVQPPVTGAATGGSQPAAVPEPAHTVVVVMENHAYAQIIGSPDAPFINTLAGRGALFTRSYAITHPSEPNYLALFSGSTQGIADDGCPYRFTTPNLAADLIKAGKSFAA